MLRKLWVLAAVACLTPVWAGQAHHVTIRAFINVSSGCQAATVDLLNSLKARYKPNVSLEMTDFGDQGKGLRHWQQSGYHCLTIEINSSPLVRFPVSGKMKAVGFLMPAGFGWTHADLERAVAAGVAGQLSKATEAEVEADLPARQITASVSAGRATVNGRQYATVAVNGRTVIYLYGVSSDTIRRAQAAAKALKLWLAKPVRLSDLTVKQTRYGFGVFARGGLVATATTGDQRTLGQDPATLAAGWVGGIKHALAGGPGR
jgi:hypothetical protein